MPRRVGDLDLGGPPREAHCQRRQKGRSLVAAVDLVDDVPGVRPKHAAEVRELHPGDRDGHPVDGERGGAPEKGVLAVLAHAAHDVVALRELRQQLRDLLGRVLQVGVERHGHVARHVAKARQDRLVLAEVAGEVERAERVRPFRRPILQDPEGAVAAAVVDHDDLVRIAAAVHHGRQAAQELRQVALLVVDRHHDGDLHRRNSASTSRIASTASSWSESERPGKSGSETIRSETKWASG